MLIMHKPSTEAREEMTVATKRRLRRIRLGAAKDGVIIPYEGVSKPADPDAPKLTNTAKRRARQRRKYEEEMAAWEADKTGNTPRPPSPNLPARPISRSEVDGDELKSERAKSKRKKRKKGTDEEEGSGDVAKLKKKKKNDDPGHLRFDDSDADTEEEAVVKKEPVKKNSKRKKKDELKNELESDGEQADPLPSKTEETDPSVEPNKIKLTKTTGKPDGIVDKTKADKANKPPKKRRFVLFVGNLSYEATEAEVTEHFKKVGTIVSVRMARPLDDAAGDKCRGFCHLEVADEETYLKALSMTHTFMGKRRINVEYSGSQTQSTKAEQKKKNMKMNALRKSGNLFEVMNPTGSGASGGNKTARRSQAKRDTQKQGNTFWV